MISRATDIRVLDYGARFQGHFGFCVDDSLHHLYKVDGFSILLFHLNFNRKFKAFSDIADYIKLIRDSDKINLRQHGFKMLKVRCSVLGLF